MRSAKIINKLKKRLYLRLGHTRITKDQHVDVTTKFVASLVGVLRRTAEQGESEGLLDVVMAVNRGSNRVANDIPNVWFPIKLMGKRAFVYFFFSCYIDTRQCLKGSSQCTISAT